MDKHAIWKWLILVGAVAFSLVVVTPPKEKIRYGIDLVGGVSITVEMDREEIRSQVRERLAADATDEQIEAEVSKILEGAQDRTLEVIRNRVDGLGTQEPIIYPAKSDRIVVQVPRADEKQVERLEDAIGRAAFLEFRMVHKETERLAGELFSKRLAPEGYTIETVGTTSYYVTDPTFPNEQRGPAYRRRLGLFEVPDAGHEFMLEKIVIQERAYYRPRFVERRRQLTGDTLKDASVDYLALGQPIVQLEFDSKGAKKFRAVTTDYAPGGARNPNPNEFRQLAIVLDETLYSAPRINEPIFGGRAQIEGSFTYAEAQFLANILRAGSLPAPVKIVEKRTVSPTLGSDSINSGIKAVLYGGIGILIFMTVYYLACGVIADLALVLNLILLPLGMILAAGFLGIFARDVVSRGAIQLPVLTLPGIAGILLTIGMAVDANVLIFERIREESVVGKRLWTAVTAGYDRAFVTIIDANLTTLLTGIILFIFGSGPIRGFAVTLCAGIVMSMFTALVVTKLMFGVLASTTRIKTLKMLSIIRGTAIDFVSKRKLAAIFSVIVIAGTWGLIVHKGNQNTSAIFGVDFTGGSALTYTFTEEVAVEDLRASLTEAGITGVHIQYQDELEAGGQSYLQVKAGGDAVDGKRPADVIKEVLAVGYPEAGFTLAAEDEVGGQVGSELKSRAVKSIILALLGIIVYLWIRFELGFAFGAIVALAHDVLFTVGVYVLFGRQISLPIVAALLTIVGYSVNDTIVVFDRIREDLRLVRNKSFKEICNLSINQTLSRTLLTSLTTLLTVVMLLVFGGGAINDFALALCIGVLVGTYSSIFVATPVVLLWHRDHKPDFAKSAT